VRGGDNPPLTIHKQIDNILTKEKEKKLSYTLLNTLEQYKQSTDNDIENDRMLMMTLRTDVADIIHKLQDYQKKEAFAVDQGDMLDQVIDTLDDILGDVCDPKEQELTKAKEYHEHLRTERNIA
jgi:transketolase|tara:strand:+ start:217 stop:588 length:372 start_codon:yes stop_codon:yes gene_type:complete